MRLGGPECSRATARRWALSAEDETHESIELSARRFSSCSGWLGSDASRLYTCCGFAAQRSFVKAGQGTPPKGGRVRGRDLTQEAALHRCCEAPPARPEFVSRQVAEDATSHVQSADEVFEQIDAADAEMRLISAHLTTIQTKFRSGFVVPPPPKPRQPRPPRKREHALQVLEACPEVLGCKTCFRQQPVGGKAPWVSRPCTPNHAQVFHPSRIPHMHRFGVWHFARDVEEFGTRKQ